MEDYHKSDGCALCFPRAGHTALISSDTYLKLFESDNTQFSFFYRAPTR